FRRRLLVHHRAHARDVAPGLAQLARVVQLLGRDLHAQRKVRPQQLVELLPERHGILGAQLFCFHLIALVVTGSAQAPTMRETKTVEIGSLAAARAKASRASVSFTPSISDRKSTRLNLQSRENLVCRLLLEKEKNYKPEREQQIADQDRRVLTH